MKESRDPRFGSYHVTYKLVLFLKRLNHADVTELIWYRELYILLLNMLIRWIKNCHLVGYPMLIFMKCIIYYQNTATTWYYISHVLWQFCFIYWKIIYFGKYIILRSIYILWWSIMVQAASLTDKFHSLYYGLTFSLIYIPRRA